MDSKKVKTYERYLLEYMSFLTSTTYGKDHVFPKDELRKATPESFVQLFSSIYFYARLQIGLEW